MGVIALKHGLRQLWIAAALLAVAPAQAAQCPPEGVNVPAPVLNLSANMAQPRYRNDRSREEISRLAGKGSAHSEAGLTHTQTEFHLRPSFKMFRQGDGAVCVTLAGVEATWNITEITVDVASKYRPGTCPHREVLEHEDQHVQISRRALVNHLPQMKAHLAAALSAFRPFMAAGDGKAAGQAVLDRLMAGAQPRIAAMQAESARDNAAIDTVTNYRAIAARCADW